MICRGLAVNGANTILIDVNKDALTDTKNEIQDLGDAQVLMLVLFAAPTSETSS